MLLVDTISNIYLVLYMHTAVDMQICIQTVYVRFSFFIAYVIAHFMKFLSNAYEIPF